MTEFFRTRYLFAVGFLSVVYLVVVLFSGPLWLRVPLGGFALLFGPGYALAAALFGRKSELPWTALFAATVGLSVVLNGAVGLFLLVIAVGLPPWFLATVDLELVVLGLLLWRFRDVLANRPFFARRRATAELPSVGTRDGLLSWPGFSRGQKTTAWVLLLLSVGALGLVFVFSFQHPTDVPTVSLGVSGPGGNSSTIPRTGHVGQLLAVSVTVSTNTSFPELKLVVETYVSSGPPPSSFTATPWSSPLSLSAGNASGELLTFNSSQTLTIGLSFTFSQSGSFAVEFALEPPAGGAPLRSVVVPITIQ